MIERTLQPPAPYSLARTVGAFARFPDEPVDVVVPGGFRRLFDVDGHIALTEATQIDSDPDAARIVLRVLNADEIPEPASSTALDSLRRMLALDESIEQVRELILNHRQIAAIDGSLRGLRRTLDPTPFEGLVSSILAQLISIQGASVVRSRLVKRFGRFLEYDGRRYWTFPRPEAVAASNVDELCGSIRMTSGKARAILAVAEASIEGRLNRHDLDSLDDAELTKYLISLPGIGPWTAEWFLVNVMGRMSVVPVGDLGIRRSTGAWFLGGEMPSQQQVRGLYEPFGEQRAYVAYYVLSAERHQLHPST